MKLSDLAGPVRHTICTDELILHVGTRHLGRESNCVAGPLTALAVSCNMLDLLKAV